MVFSDNFGEEFGISKRVIKFGAGIAIFIVFLSTLIYLKIALVAVPKGHLVPIMKKTGKEITNDVILAPSNKYKGPQKKFLEVGWHWKNPYFWWAGKPVEATYINKDEVGVLVRLYGDKIPHNQIISLSDNEKGIVKDVLKPGTSNMISPWEYMYPVEKYSLQKIEPGFKGLVTLLVGKDPVNPNVFVVQKGERGQQPYLLNEGIHVGYSNPYIYLVTPFDVRSQKFQYEVVFPSKYGWDIKAEGYIEWAPDLDKLPELFVKYVDEEDLKDPKSRGRGNIQNKLILPFARSFFRLVGSRFMAIDYITGDTRVIVQNSVWESLREVSAKEGIIIKSFAIRATDPPKEIRQQYGRREIANREKEKFEKEILTEIGSIVMLGGALKVDKDGAFVLDESGSQILIGGKPKFVDPNDESKGFVREGGRLERTLKKKMKGRETALGEIRVTVAEEIRDAERYSKVELTKSQTILRLAEIELEAAKDQAGKILADGFAEANVQIMANKAEESVLKDKVESFGTGEDYADYLISIRFAQSVTRVLSGTDGPLAEWFAHFVSPQD